MDVKEGLGQVLTCLICCTSERKHFPSSNFLLFGRSQCISDDGTTFDNFCRQLLSLQKVELDFRGKGSLSSLSVCSSCMADISSALEANEGVDEVEGRVRSLQWSLLREMRELQEHITVLGERLERIGESVKKSEEEELVTGLSGGGGQERLLASENEKNDVFKFRQSILTVSDDLRRFRGDLSEKCSAGNKENVIIRNTEDIPVVDDEVEVKLEDEEEANDDPLESGGWKSECGFSPELNDLSPNHDYDSEAESDMEFLPNESDDESEEAPSNLGSYSEDGGDTESEVEVGSSDYDDNDPLGGEKLEPKPSHLVRVRPFKKRRKRSTKVPAKPISLEDIDLELEEISDFRKFALRSLLNHHPRKPMQNRKEVNSAQFHLHNLKEDQKAIRFEFNPDTRSVHLMGVQVEISDQDKMIKCSKCSHAINVKFSPKKRSKEGLDHDAKRLMKTHIVDEHYPNELKCPMCTDDDPDPKPCHSMKLHLAHLHTHLTTRRVHICSVCGKPLTTIASLRYHLWTHKNEEEKAQAMAEGEIPPKLALDPVFNCSTCSKEFPTVHRLKEHEESHIPKAKRERFTCPICGVKLLKRGLDVHLKYVCNPEGVTSIRCSICEKVLKSKPSLQGHMRKHHSNKTAAPLPRKLERSHQCETCGKTFKSGKWLDGHRRKAHSEEQVKCLICEKTFRNKKNFKSHMRRIHSGSERPFQCEVCLKTFKLKFDLNIHMLSHSEEKVYECGKGCGRSFPKTYLGKRHERSCNVKVKCSLCEKTLTERNVTSHMKRVHSQGDERPYQCEVCARMFKVKEDLSRHLKIHSEEKRYQCEKGCGKEFSMSKYCRRHEKVCKGKAKVAIKDEVD